MADLSETTCNISSSFSEYKQTDGVCTDFPKAFQGGVDNNYFSIDCLALIFFPLS